MISVRPLDAKRNPDRQSLCEKWSWSALLPSLTVGVPFGATSNEPHTEPRA